jgi:hypothetical protein
MQIKWYRKKSDNQEITTIVTGDMKADLKSSASAPLAGEDAAQTIVRARNMNSWLDQAVRDCQESGGLDHLAGKGKPIVVQDGDPLNSMLKNANVLPAWLELQHEIRNRILKLIERMDLGQQDFTDEITAINKQIIRYNQSVPTPVLQKGRLVEGSVREQLERWL